MVCLRRIRRGGLSVWLREQTERQALLEELLQNYNEGRLMSFYCKACARMPAGLIKKALKSAKAKSAGEAADRPDVKSRAAFMKETIKNLASEKKIDLG
ncbi:hypothetical protein JW906_15270 [bacterium]|nr:hypothetical protein [bacterium]